MNAKLQAALNNPESINNPDAIIQGMQEDGWTAEVFPDLTIAFSKGGKTCKAGGAFIGRNACLAALIAIASDTRDAAAQVDDLANCEWEKQDRGCWVFGKKLRGVVRKPLAEVFDCNRVFINEPTGFRWQAAGAAGQKRTWLAAIEAAERAMGVSEAGGTSR